MMKDQLFVRLDGDNIGDSIELALMNEDFRQAQEIHNRIQKGIQSLVKVVVTIDNVNLLLVGSDDILFTIARANYTEVFVLNLNNKFFKETGFTLSIGVGVTLNQALDNLKRAKISGRNRIVSNIK